MEEIGRRSRIIVLVCHAAEHHCSSIAADSSRGLCHRPEPTFLLRVESIEEPCPGLIIDALDRLFVARTAMEYSIYELMLERCSDHHERARRESCLREHQCSVQVFLEAKGSSEEDAMLVVVDFIDAPKTPIKTAHLKKELACNLDQAWMLVLEVTWHAPQSVVPIRRPRCVVDGPRRTRHLRSGFFTPNRKGATPKERISWPFSAPADRGVSPKPLVALGTVGPQPNSPRRRREPARGRGQHLHGGTWHA